MCLGYLGIYYEVKLEILNMFGILEMLEMLKLQLPCHSCGVHPETPVPLCEKEKRDRTT
jgi:hypothetical protein